MGCPKTKSMNIDREFELPLPSQFPCAYHTRSWHHQCMVLSTVLSPLCSGYAKLFGALTPHESARPAALTKAGALIRSSLTGHSAGSASPAHDHSDSEKGAEVRFPVTHPRDGGFRVRWRTNLSNFAQFITTCIVAHEAPIECFAGGLQDCISPTVGSGDSEEACTWSKDCRSGRLLMCSYTGVAGSFSYADMDESE